MISISLLVIVLLLLVVAAIEPARTRQSDFEIARLERLGRVSDLELNRRRHFDTIISIQHVISTILLVVSVALVLAWLGVFWGVVASIVLALTYKKVAHLTPLKQMAAKLYGLIERPLIQFCVRYEGALRVIRIHDMRSRDEGMLISSKEELLDALKRPPQSLSGLELTLIKSALTFDSRRVEDIMTPRSVIKSIEHDELLGPILLSELHKTGHSRFPVTAGDIDHIVGVLYVRDLLTIDGSKNSSKVSQVMDEEVCFIREDQSLSYALRAFTKTEKLLFVVINQYRETVGVLTLEDVIEALIGQKINDEFEHHTDLRKVAEQNAVNNNSPKAAKDV